VQQRRRSVEAGNVLFERSGALKHVDEELHAAQIIATRVGLFLGRVLLRLQRGDARRDVFEVGTHTRGELIDERDVVRRRRLPLRDPIFHRVDDLVDQVRHLVSAQRPLTLERPVRITGEIAVGGEPPERVVGEAVRRHVRKRNLVRRRRRLVRREGIGERDIVRRYGQCQG